ncbi:MAG: insulinase family protein [Saprospiraceae bacterium]|nr:insulinase family protein [Saprospiraceae bacterium]
MKKLKPILTVALFIATAIQISYAQAKLVEKVTKKGDEILIPYEKYVLPNGLTLVIHEDHSDPLVHVDVTYHVGSAREEIGKSGFAHFFEHMMFQGSDNVADEEHFKLVTAAGGTLNGSTNRDRTNYYETLPSNQLETALWLEADRMGFLLDAVTQKKFEVQRSTVKNERGQNYDNRPYGLSSETTAKNLYPYGHPYSWLTIGYVEDLDRVDVNDLKNFFLRWYGPNNAVVTVGGDVDVQNVVKLVEKYFGSIPRGKEVANMQPMLAKLEKDRYCSYEDQYIRVPLLTMTFPVPQRFSTDEAALDCLAEILGQGKNSLLYKNLVKTQAATQASAFNSTSELAGEFTFRILPAAGKSLAEMEKLVRQTIEEFEKRGVTDDDITRFIAGMESNTISSLSSVSGKVSQLAAYQTYANNPNFLTEESKRYRAITKADVMRVYNQYIKGKNCVILSVYPKGQANAVAAADNYKVNTEGYVAPDYGYAGMKYVKAKDDFDRSKKPTGGASPVIKVPETWTAKFKNGIQVMGTKNDEIPKVTLLLSIDGGNRLLANDLGKAGLADITAKMLNEATESFTSEQMSSELDKIGASISFSAGADAMNIFLETPTKNLDRALTLLAEKILRPKFDIKDFERIVKQSTEQNKIQQSQPAFIASNVFSKTLYGNDNIKATPVSGYNETLSKLTLADVTDFYAKAVTPSLAKLVVVGNVDQKDIMPKLQFLDQWKPRKISLPKAKEGQNIAKTKIYLIDKPKSAQSEIRVGNLTTTPYDATGEYYESTLMAFPLGGAFNSRVNLNMREDKGWTYGCRAGFSADKDGGSFVGSGGFKVNATDSAVIEFMKEFKNYAEKGITAEELAFMKSSLGQRDALRYESNQQKAFFLANILNYKLPKNYTEKQNKILQSVTANDINRLAKKYVNPDKMNIVVVGDKKVIMAGLQKLGYEIVELDANGQPLTVKP